MEFKILKFIFGWSSVCVQCFAFESYLNHFLFCSSFWTNLDVTYVITQKDHIESCPVDGHLAYRMDKKAVLKKRNAEETKPILAIYDEEASAASAVPTTSGHQPILEPMTTMAGEDFLLWQSVSRHILVLATGSNIRLMATRRTWALDGTFKVVPQWYQQLFTIYAFFASNLLPAIYCLCTDKNIATYGFILSKSGITGNPQPES
ncbi:hypothetical protein T05_14452 [Trichinella murrelli]|uniref:Uncharacterized protein n=1 Tax=Trichinella murrelli TaxID=144512 RepID=A0A0V0U792_9BILA|nr:hypothetical protein T05_14452 [Trichinella murrelli]